MTIPRHIFSIHNLLPTNQFLNRQELLELRNPIYEIVNLADLCLPQRSPDLVQLIQTALVLSALYPMRGRALSCHSVPIQKLIHDGIKVFPRLWDGSIQSIFVIIIIIVFFLSLGYTLVKLAFFCMKRGGVNFFKAVVKQSKTLGAKECRAAHGVSRGGSAGATVLLLPSPASPT